MQGYKRRKERTANDKKGMDGEGDAITLLIVSLCKCAWRWGRMGWGRVLMLQKPGRI